MIDDKFIHILPIFLINYVEEFVPISKALRRLASNRVESPRVFRCYSSWPGAYLYDQLFSLVKFFKPFEFCPIPFLFFRTMSIYPRSKDSFDFPPATELVCALPKLIQGRICASESARDCFHSSIDASCSPFVFIQNVYSKALPCTMMISRSIINDTFRPIKSGVNGDADSNFNSKNLTRGEYASCNTSYQIKSGSSQSELLISNSKILEMTI